MNDVATQRLVTASGGPTAAPLSFLMPPCPVE